MNKLTLLIVEDDKELRDSYSKQIKLFNLDQTDILVEEIFAIDDTEAKQKLTYEKIDAAVIDLKLGTTDIDYKGNVIIDIIKNNLRFPAYILTANPEKIEEEKNNQNDLFKIKVKGTEDANFTLILNELKAIHLTGITKILGGAGQIEKYLNEIFWKHLSNSVNTWASDSSRTPEQKEKSLLRYTLSYIQEHLDLTDSGDFENYTPSEFYIIPPVKQNLFTGDIVEYNNRRCIVLTPACDFGNKNVDNILFVTIKNWESLDSEFSKRPISKAKGDKLKDYLGNKKPRYHFTPKTKDIEAGFIDFQDKITLNFERVNILIQENKARRIATIASPFLKDIISRYSSYYSRQGSPDFHTEEVYNSLF